jgi:RNA polymerase sigma-70 factor (ECF subfamily)
MSSVAEAFGSDYVNALRQGDPAIEAHFVDHFSPILLRTLRRKVRSTDQAWELRQETFLRVLAAVRSGRGVHKPDRFEVFVIGVCNNVVRETYREQRRSVALSTLETEPAANFPSAYSLVLAKETNGKVRRTLAQLDIREQSILEAMLLDEQNKDEICRWLGVSRSYLRVLLHRAKKRFRIQVGSDARQGVRRDRSRPVLRECKTAYAPTGRHSCAPWTNNSLAFRCNDSFAQAQPLSFGG